MNDLPATGQPAPETLTKIETMLLAGATHTQIARETNHTPNQINRLVQHIHQQWANETPGNHNQTERTLEYQRLERQRLWITPQAQTGDIGANNTLLRIAKRKAELLGLDAPTNLNITVTPLAQHLTNEELAEHLKQIENQ